MVKIAEIDQAELEKWLSKKPKVIKEMVAQCPPDRLYRMKSTGHKVTLYSYAEDKPVTIFVTAQYNAVCF